jgi:cell division protein FtsB
VALTTEQRRKNRIALTVLVVVVLAIFAWTLFRGTEIFAGFAGMAGR